MGRGKPVEPADVSVSLFLPKGKMEIAITSAFVFFLLVFVFETYRSFPRTEEGKLCRKTAIQLTIWMFLTLFVIIPAIIFSLHLVSFALNEFTSFLN